jgi:hypothetical protein
VCQDFPDHIDALDRIEDNPRSFMSADCPLLPIDETLRESCTVAIIDFVPQASGVDRRSSGRHFRHNQREAQSSSQPAPAAGFERGQVAQVVERSPEKAGVGGSTPSLATMFSTT